MCPQVTGLNGGLVQKTRDGDWETSIPDALVYFIDNPVAVVRLYAVPAGLCTMAPTSMWANPALEAGTMVMGTLNMDRSWAEVMMVERDRTPNGEEIERLNFSIMLLYSPARLGLV